ncbi:hypothetical protein [Notoacmeibacter sp. MSK16QG-6]|uniref:hypothetical protein n=1 Tax=Notoacmeibacter sp. MSK16QG-6 TaxID=2957982 RepID=UPI00209F0E15|nr:hypothetical protein [Notoacmeibacter sp. MSK16QG-6]MCP1200614.1 hypothetical protein [Notoacmeibacter sp. MSK16QG-6]
MTDRPDHNVVALRDVVQRQPAGRGLRKVPAHRPPEQTDDWSDYGPTLRAIIDEDIATALTEYDAWLEAGETSLNA